MSLSSTPRFRRSLPALLILAVLAAPSVQAQIVINEIHYDPLDDTLPEEYIELYNAGTNSVDLGEWRFSNGIDYTFPAGTTMPAGGYLVVAQDPATILTTYGISAFGPWTGRLSNQGEEVRLRDAADATVDRVAYQAGFPWPVCPQGSSMELLHPDLDNDLGGSWRSSRFPEEETYIAAQDTDWRYFKGFSEPPTPGGLDWRSVDYPEDGSWLTGQTPIGYGDGDDRTVLGDMRNGYSTVFARHPLVIPPDGMPAGLRVRVYTDDGAILYLNGQEVDRWYVSAGPKAYNDTANNHEASWEEVVIGNASAYLTPGTNQVALHGLNQALNSSDFSLDCEVFSSQGIGTGNARSPGGLNSQYTLQAPPQIRQVTHTPEQPTAGVDVVITAKVTDPGGVGDVVLSYQLVNPGSYIRRTDPAYEAAANWTELGMHDDGVGGDALAGDAIYSAVMPAALQTHRRLVRYRIRFADLAGNQATAPYPDDAQPNFAYFVFDGFPAWSGSFTPGGAVDTFPPELMDDIAVYHLIAANSDVISSQYSGSSDGVHMLGTLVYDGRVYDHVEFENRGEASTYQSGKNKWRLHFNRTHGFAARDYWGRNYPSPWNKMNFDANSSPWAPVNRGMAGLDEAVSYRLYTLAGVPSPRTHYVHFRVIDDAVEVHPSDQYEGDLWGLYLAVEHPDGSFLDDRNLPDGNLYKIEGGNGDKKEQGDTQPKDSSDWSDFSNFSGATRTEAAWRDRLHLPSYQSFRAVNRLVGNVDLRHGYNHYFYHHPDDHWYVIPWDLDMMFISETHWEGTIRQENNLSHGALSTERHNRAREVLDLMASDRSPSGGQIGQLINEYADIVNPPGQALTWADLDANLWNYHPRTRGDPNSHSGQGSHKGNFYYSPFQDSRIGGSYTRYLDSSDHEGFVTFLLDYTTDTYAGGAWAPGNGVTDGYGYEFLKEEARDIEVPDTPTSTYLGAAGFPVNDLRFQSGTFSEPVNGTTFAAMNWRIAEIAAPGVAGYTPGTPRSYELETLWESGERTPFAAEILIPSAVISVGHTYRVRVRHKGDSGRWSHWSAPIQFTTAEPDGGAALVENLRITEIMYHAPGTDMEYVELYHAGTNLTLNLEGVVFTSGIEFAFQNATPLPPGGVILVVNQAAMADLNAFRATFQIDPDVPIVGPYDGSLNNAGETVRLKTSLGGAEIVEVSYGEDRPWPVRADGGGSSLEIIHPLAPAEDPFNWRASYRILGSAGAVDLTPVATVLINEVLTHTDAPLVDSVELVNPTDAAIDISGWYLSDATDYRKYRVPSNTVLAAGAYQVLDETSFNPNGEWNPDPGKGPVDPLHHFSFSGANGDEVHLVVADALDELVGFADSVSFGAAPNGESLGRWPDGQGRLYPMLSRSLGATNPEPRVGPVVIDEIMYHPADTNAPGVLEFIEIHNSGSVAEDLSRWSLAGAVSYGFPAGITLDAGDSLVLVGFDPSTDLLEFSTFQAAYGALTPLGPWSGQLDNADEVVRLQRADAPPLLDPGYYPQLEEERVSYDDVSPWPVAAAGTGLSLQRLNPYTFGDSPANWVAWPPSPGSHHDSVLFQAWRKEHFSAAELLQPAVSGEEADPDGDGMNNRSERIADTDPRSAASVFRVQVSRGTNGLPVVAAETSTERHYQLDQAEPAPGTGWLPLFPARPGTGRVTGWTPESTAGQETYRLDAILRGPFP